jgi:FlaA1/EpsC-like NDP-sugar epimerase
MWTMALLAPLSLVVFWKARLYEGSWRLAKIDDFVRASAACGTVLFVAVVLCSWQFQIIPPSVLVVYSLLSAFFIVGSRASYRVLLSAQRVAGPAGVATLLYGPGPDEFVQARDLIERAGSFGLRPVGFVTPTGLGQGRRLAGLKIWGSIDDLSLHAGASGAEAVVLARQRVPDAAVRRFEHLCRAAKVVPYRLNTELEAMWGEGLGDPVAAPFFADIPHPVQRARDLVGEDWPIFQPGGGLPFADRRMKNRRRTDSLTHPSPVPAPSEPREVTALTNHDVKPDAVTA